MATPFILLSGIYGRGSRLKLLPPSRTCRRRGLQRDAANTLINTASFLSSSVCGWAAPRGALCPRVVTSARFRLFDARETVIFHIINIDLCRLKSTNTPRRNIIDLHESTCRISRQAPASKPRHRVGTPRKASFSVPTHNNICSRVIFHRL